MQKPFTEFSSNATLVIGNSSMLQTIGKIRPLIYTRLFGQQNKVITLEQSPGEFTQKKLKSLLAPTHLKSLIIMQLQK